MHAPKPAKKPGLLRLLIFLLLASCSPGKNQAQPEAGSSDESRLLNLQGSYNTRDFGGYLMPCGKSIRRGLIYRSDDLSRLTESDLNALAELGLKTVLDFRADDEVARSPNRIAPSVKNNLRLPVQVGNVIDLGSVTPDNGPEIMLTVNRKLVHEYQAEYRDFFKLVSNREKLPLLFHCSAGKDRTGLASALFLAALGADRELIYHDYLLSAENIKSKYGRMVRQSPHLAPLLTVRREYLEAAFEEIDTRYGGPEKYLTEQLGVDIEKLKSIYLE